MEVEKRTINYPNEKHIQHLQLDNNKPTISQWWIFNTHKGDLIAYKYSNYLTETYCLYEQSNYFDSDHSDYTRIPRDNVPSEFHSNK